MYQFDQQHKQQKGNIGNEALIFQWNLIPNKDIFEEKNFIR